MEGKLQTSFIPKKSVIENKVRSNPTTNIFTMVAWFVFIVVAAASIGVYAYEQYLTNSINTKNASLTNILTQFDTASVNHFVELDAKLKAASDIINNHLAFSALLKLIADNTLVPIQFTSLKYSYDTSSYKTSLSLSGKAPDFASVALQSDRFAGLSYFKDQSFSGVTLDESGAVLFNFSASVAPSAFKYQSIFSATSTSN